MAQTKAELEPPRASQPRYLGLRARRFAKAILLILSIYLIAAQFFNLRPATIFDIFGMSRPKKDTGASTPLLGVYFPVEPNTYDGVEPQNVKPQVKEVADLMTDLYKLFIKMGYMEEAHFAWPPHNETRIDTEELALYGFTKDVVDLMQLLPYRMESSVENWNFGTDAGEFIKGGDFMPDPRRTLDEPERTELRQRYEYAQDLLDPFFALYSALPGGPEDRRDDDADERSWNHEDGPYMRPTYLALSGCGNHGSIMILNTENCKHRPSVTSA